MVFVASIMRHKLCMIYAFFGYFFQNHFYQKLYSDCCDKFDYPGFIVYLSWSSGFSCFPMGLFKKNFTLLGGEDDQKVTKQGKGVETKCDFTPFKFPSHADLSKLDNVYISTYGQTWKCKSNKKLLAHIIVSVVTFGTIGGGRNVKT